MQLWQALKLVRGDQVTDCNGKVQEIKEVRLRWVADESPDNGHQECILILADGKEYDSCLCTRVPIFIC